MTTFETFPDAEQLAVEILLASSFGAFTPWIGTELPDDFGEMTGPDLVIVIHRFGGVPVERHRIDSPRLQFDVFGTTKANAFDVATAARVNMMSAEGQVYSTPPCFLSGVADDMGLTWLPDPKDLRPRYIFALQLTVHA